MASRRLHLLPSPSAQAPSEYETSPDQLFYRIAHLTRGQQYMLWVAAVTSAGRGNISEKVTIEPAGKGTAGAGGGTRTLAPLSPAPLSPAPGDALAALCWAAARGDSCPGQRRGAGAVSALVTHREGLHQRWGLHLGGLPARLTSSLPPSPCQDHLLWRHRHYPMDEGREAAVQLGGGAGPCHQVDQGQVLRGLPAVSLPGPRSSALAASRWADVSCPLPTARTLPSL